MNEEERLVFNKNLLSAAEKFGIHAVKNIPNEDGRVKELKRLKILDRELSSEKKYNSLTLVASYITNCKLAFINILGSDVQQCKLSYGLTIDQSDAVKEIPRIVSVCQFSLENPGQPLIIEDLSKDPRTKKLLNLAAYDGLSFYAGAPLITSKGFSIGTLCVVDKNPKKLEKKQIECLKLLAENIVQMIEEETNDIKAKQIHSKDLATKQIDTKYFTSASVIFTDFVNFTQHTDRIDPGELLETLNSFFDGFDKIMKKHHVTKIKTIGDSYMAVSGIGNKVEEHALNISKAAVDILQYVNSMNIQRAILEKPKWEIRIGIHTGPIISGVTGNMIDVWGDTVNIASRLEGTSERGKIHISEITADYISEYAELKERGNVELKNKGIFRTFFLEEIL